ncbi:MAG: histidine kinase, partial [Caulobacter sp.]|nr:histidine kinase [Caulobacter sp.]
MTELGLRSRSVVRTFPGGDLAKRTHQFDWAATPLGPAPNWSPSLKLTVGLILATPFPMALRWGPDFILIYNDGYAPILGDKHPEALGQPFRQTWPEVQADLGPLHQAILDGERAGVFSEDLPLTIRRRDDGPEQAYFTVSYSPIPDDTAPSGVGGVLITAIETTERLRTEQALRASEERYQLALDAAGGVGTWNWDVPSNRIYADQRFALLFGVDPARAALGAPVDDFLAAIHPDDLDRVTEAIERVLAAGGAFAEEYRLVQANGEVRWVFARGHCYLDAAGRPQRYPGVLVDITERKEAADRLAVQEETLRLAVESADVGTWDLDLRTRVLTWSDRCKAMFGLPVDAAVTLDDFLAGLHDGDLQAVMESFGRAIDPESRADYEVEYRTAAPHDGGERWIAAKGRALFDASGRALRAVGTTVNITDRKRAELHLRLMVNELNHRVKNSLATIQAIAAQTFRDAHSLPDAQDAFTSRIIALAEAHDVLTRENWESADIQEVARRTAGLHGGEDRFDLTGPSIRLSPRTALSLSMALHELATNALKYGALSVPAGRVAIDWSVTRDAAGARLSLVWSEHGGPPVTPPTRKGFGSRLVERGLAAELAG